MDWIPKLVGQFAQRLAPTGGVPRALLKVNHFGICQLTKYYQVRFNIYDGSESLQGHALGLVLAAHPPRCWARPWRYIGPWSCSQNQRLDGLGDQELGARCGLSSPCSTASLAPGPPLIPKSLWLLHQPLLSLRLHSSWKCSLHLGDLGPIGGEFPTSSFCFAELSREDKGRGPASFEYFIFTMNWDKVPITASEPDISLLMCGNYLNYIKHTGLW